MPLLLAVLLAAAPAEPAPKAVVLLGGYQTLGVDAKSVTELEKAIATALASRPVELVPAAETEKLRKGLGLCGEDAACLASVGERASARWVLGYGAGKVGSAVLVNLVLVNVESGKSVASAGTKAEAKAMAATAAPLVDELLKNVELVPKPVVAVEPPPPPPPPTPQKDAPTTTVLVVAPDPNPPPVVVEQGRPMKRAAIGAGIGTGVFLLATIVLGLAAAGNYNQINGKPPSDTRDAAVRSQPALNIAGDTMLGVTVAAGAATVVFAVLDAAR